MDLSQTDKNIVNKWRKMHARSRVVNICFLVIALTGLIKLVGGVSQKDELSILSGFFLLIIVCVVVKYHSEAIKLYRIVDKFLDKSS